MPRSIPALFMVVLGAVLASCGGSSDTSESNPAEAPTGQTAATQAPQARPGFGGVIAVSELVVGDNRFSLGIIDNASGQPVPDAQVRFRFFTVQGSQGTLKSEAEGRFIAPARDAGV